MKKVFIETLLVVGFCVALGFACQKGIAGDAQDSPGRAFCEAHQANLESLRQFKCKYAYARASAPDLQSALAGKYSNIRSCDYVLVVDGAKQKLQSLTKYDDTRRPDEKGIIESKNGRLISRDAEFFPIADLSSKQGGLSFTSLWNQVTVSGKTSSQIGREQTPLYAVGAQNPFGPANLISLTGIYAVSLSSKGPETVRDEPAVHVNIKSWEWGNADWYFGPNQGYLPLLQKKHSFSPTGKHYPENQTHVLESRQLGKQGWFPTHIVQVFFGYAQGDPVRVVDFRVTELTDKVTDDDLSVEVPAGTSVFWDSDENQNSNQFRTRQKEKLRPDDIARIMKMLDQKTTEPLMDTAIRVEEQSRSKWYIAGSIVAVFVVAIALFRRYRGRST